MKKLLGRRMMEFLIKEIKRDIQIPKILDFRLLKREKTTI